jgi:hypothetical protein
MTNKYNLHFTQSGKAHEMAIEAKSEEERQELLELSSRLYREEEMKYEFQHSNII